MWALIPVMALSELILTARVPRSSETLFAQRTSGACPSTAFAAGAQVRSSAAAPRAAQAARLWNIDPPEPVEKRRGLHVPVVDAATERLFYRTEMT
jgi:hypothetical protein